MRKAVAVGDTCIDFYDNMERWYPTGNCVDFAVNLADLGFDTSIVAFAGSDNYGREVSELLQKHGVDTSHLYTRSGNTPITHMSLGGESGRDRIHGSFDEGVMKNFVLTDDDLDFIGNFDFVHTHKYGRADRWLKEFSKKGCQIVYDFSTGWDMDQHSETEMLVDYGVFSWKEDDAQIRAYLMDAVLIYGMKAAIATFGEKGSLACVRKDNPEQASGIEDVTYLRQPAYLVPEEKLINTVGAGDSFIAGVVGGLLRGLPLRECLAEGARVSAQIVQIFEPYLEAGEASDVLRV